MSLPKKILVPTDFGAGSEAALAYAIDLGRKLDAELVLLHVFDLPPMAFPDPGIVMSPELTAHLGEGAKLGIERLVREHEAAGVRMQGMTRQGETWRSIVDAADELGAELVVMATHGRRGLPHALLGSVAEKVVRSARCPVLTVHAPGA